LQYNQEKHVTYIAVKKECSVEVNTIKSKIESLEKHLNIRLLKSLNKRVYPTDAGMKYYDSCRDAFKNLENIVGTIKKN
jgi:DNA-binding transcriptional LysR family regulator